LKVKPSLTPKHLRDQLEKQTREHRFVAQVINVIKRMYYQEYSNCCRGSR
jgi:SOS response regulatory protein OraA/RecX